MTSYLLVITIMLSDTIGFQTITPFPNQVLCLTAKAKSEVRASEGIPREAMRISFKCVAAGETPDA